MTGAHRPGDSKVPPGIWQSSRPAGQVTVAWCDQSHALVEKNRVVSLGYRGIVGRCRERAVWRCYEDLVPRPCVGVRHCDNMFSVPRTALDFDERALRLSVYNPKGSERRGLAVECGTGEHSAWCRVERGRDPTTKLRRRISAASVVGAQKWRADSTAGTRLQGDRVSVRVSLAVQSALWV